MTTNFLHDDKPLDIDQLTEMPAPNCPACGQAMWLLEFVRKSVDDGTHDVRHFGCKACGNELRTVDGVAVEDA